MDASNPIAGNTRVTGAALGAYARTRARQGLRALREHARTLNRVHYPVYETSGLMPGWEKDIGAVVASVRREVNAYMKSGDVPLDMVSLAQVCDVFRPFSICGLMVDGVPVHSQQRATKEGRVFVKRQWLGVGVDEWRAVEVAEHMDRDRFVEIMEKLPVYSHGTPRGFYARCTQQLGRKCVQTSKLMSRDRFFGLLEECLPYDKKALPDWGDNLSQQIDLVVVTPVASSGAPCWVPKCDAWAVTRDNLIPLIVDSIKNNSLLDLWKKEPELWLCELKNKEDRYEDAVKKTRPYLNTPFAWHLLFACLNQPFTEALYTFDQHSTSCNAYGFSYAHGGGDRLVEAVRQRVKKKGDTLFYVYGDDVDFYYHDGKNVLRVCPDFRQMDGSVDHTTIYWTIDWIVNSFRAKWGDDMYDFWRCIGEIWKEFATQPYFVVDQANVEVSKQLGLEEFAGHCPVFRKKSRDGLMTGVAGTTLFDTVKSIVAYKLYQESLRDHPSMLREEKAVAFFADLGLEIKEGTWRPEVVNLYPKPGDLWTTQCFLGVQLLCVQHGDNTVMVPTRPEEEWYKMFLTPKKAEVKTSNLARDRYAFDSMRGLLVCGGVYHDEFRIMMNTIMSKLSPECIVMEVQDGSTGAPPELSTVVGSDFKYPTSAGWPTVEWVTELYASSEKKMGISMSQVFEDVESFDKVRTRPELPVPTTVFDIVDEDRIMSSLIVASDIPPPPQFRDIEVPPLIGEIQPPELSVQPNPRSHIIDLETGAEWKKMPDLETLLAQELKPMTTSQALLGVLLSHIQEASESGEDPLHEWKVESLMKAEMAPVELVQFLIHMVSVHGRNVNMWEMWKVVRRPVGVLSRLASKFRVEEPVVEAAARRLGYLVVGPPRLKLVSSVPIAGLSPVLAVDQEHQIRTVEDRVIEKRRQMREATVEKVDQIRRQVRVMEDVAARAVGPKAQVAHAVSEAEKLPDFVPIVGFDVSATSVQARRSQASAILQHHGYQVAMRTRSETVVDFYLIKGEDQFLVLSLEGYSFKDAWIRFNEMIVNRYVRQAGRSIRPGESWAEAEELNYKDILRVYSTARGPILVQKTGEPVHQIGSHAKLRTVNTDEGLKVEVWRDENSTAFLSLKSGTARQHVQRLSQLLGEEVHTERVVLQDLIQQYPKIERYVRSYYKRITNAQKAQKTTTTSSSSSAPPPGWNKQFRPAEKKASPSPKRKGSGERNSPGRFKGKEVKRVRFPSRSSSANNRQGGTTQGNTISKPKVMDRNPGIKDGGTVSKVPPGCPPNRGSVQRKQDDGRPVRRVLDSRL